MKIGDRIVDKKVLRKEMLIKRDNLSKDKKLFLDNRIKERLEEMMMDNTELTKDLGTILVGREAVQAGLIDEIGGISSAMKKLRMMIEEKN